LSQVSAAFTKTIKEFLRNRPTLFWTIAWPIIWVLIGSFSFAGYGPRETVPYFRGSYTISMMVFALMIAGMSNLPSSIAGDRENGLLSKLMSMPISPRKDFVGRILALVAFSALAAALVTVVGLAVGARFTGTVIDIFKAIGFLLLVICAAAGIGLIIGTLIKHLQGAIMTGVGIAVVTASISGLFAPYTVLPAPLQLFSRIYPISSANASVTCSLLGESIAGYNPLTASQVGMTIALSLFLLVLGTVLYSRLGWRLE
jgi:ABC-2 type transport system permease protein